MRCIEVLPTLCKVLNNEFFWTQADQGVDTSCVCVCTKRVCVCDNWNPAAKQFDWLSYASPAAFPSHYSCFQNPTKCVFSYQYFQDNVVFFLISLKID